MKPSIWIFGYGSILWRPDFKFSRAVPAQLKGFQRRLWQGSTDHRGSTALPGAVATLRRDPGEITTGIAYSLEGAALKKALKDLNHREKNGYEQQKVTITLDGQSGTSALTYIAPAENPWDLGGPSEFDIAARVLHASGPSGSNLDYFLRLHAANLALSGPDTHLNMVYDLIEPDLSKPQRIWFEALHNDPTLLPCLSNRRLAP